jgi:phosphoglycolate phosphatase-like HAD superfamily hydrolase
LKILALDFDGVIVDSAWECLFVSYNAYFKVYKRKKKDFFGGEPFTFENWENIKERYKKETEHYRIMRPYIRGANDYGLIIKLMEEKKIIENQKEFDKYRKSVDFDFEAFHQEFYKERDRLQELDFKAWFNLEPSYSKIVEGIKQLLERGTKIIITTSNRLKSIAPSFAPEYLGFEIKQEDILDKRFGEDKSEQMRQIVKSYNIKFEDIYFVDDQVNHLIQTKTLGVKVLLAGWSYATKAQKEEARKQNIPIIEKEEDFYYMIRNALKVDI